MYLDENKIPDQWAFMWAPIWRPLDATETVQAIKAASHNAVVAVLSGPHSIQRHRVLSGSPAPDDCLYLNCGDGNVWLVAQKKCVERIELLEQTAVNQYHYVSGLVA